MIERVYQPSRFSGQLSQANYYRDRGGDENAQTTDPGQRGGQHWGQSDRVRKDCSRACPGGPFGQCIHITESHGVFRFLQLPARPGLGGAALCQKPVLTLHRVS
jgi:hypothetical protein